MFERPSSGERVLLVFIVDRSDNHRNIDDDRSEFIELATSAGLFVTECLTCNRSRPDPRLYIGSGKLEEIAAAAGMHEAEAVLCSKPLSPSQERNLEAELRMRVLDRNALILDIFAQRARTFEGKLQVELAQLVHLSTRLVRGWTHLERQKGGIGLRGPGETQLETDRRLLAVRVKTIRRRLEKVRKQREQGRRKRSKSGVPAVAVVGYTNAGKSTLFNRLTDDKVYAADQLFATLDPTLRRLELGAGRHCIIADTVGFISNLPHELVDAFRSTLVETREADLLLHVVDASDDEKDLKIESVNEVLAEIGAGEVPQLMIYNKIDRAAASARIDYAQSEVGNNDASAIWLSALTGAGFSVVPDVIGDLLNKDRIRGWLHLDPSQGRLRSMAYEAEAVVEESVQQDGTFILELNVDRVLFESWCKNHLEIAERFSTDNAETANARASSGSGSV